MENSFLIKTKPMNFLKKPFVFLLLFILLSSCNGDDSSSAKSICECAKPLIDLNVQMQSLASSGKQEEMQALFPKAAELQKEMIDCSKKSLSSDVDKETLKKAINGSCNLPEQLITTLMNEI